MNQPIQTCDPAVIDAFLVGELDQGQCKVFESHLESCSECRDGLQMQAADAEAWKEAQQYLPDDPNDLDRLGDSAVDDAGWSSGSQDYQRLLDSLGPTDDPQMLGRMGHFEVSAIIGSGGMGIVLKAFEPQLSRFVAIKVLSPDQWNNENARLRFAREARAAAAVVHENVVEIHSVSTDGDIPYYSMTYLRGETLADRIKNRGALDVDEILRISKQMADGIAAAHKQGLVHRDLKPANVFLSQGAERVHITDFGLAKVEGEDQLTKTGCLAGTPAFMSPEQIKAEPLDARSDLFSLGSVIYSMCTGVSPFRRDRAIQTVRMICDESPERLEDVNPAIPTWLAAIVARLHQRNPIERYQSASDLSADLSACLAHAQNPESCIQPRSVLRLKDRYEKASRLRDGLTRKAFASLAGIGLIAVISWMMWGDGAGSPMQTAGEQMIFVEGQVVDSQDSPLAGATVLAVRKTWTGGYRQEPLKTKTDAKGRFKFDNFATAGKQYAYLLTALPKGHSMSSVYQLVQDGSQQAPVKLSAQASKPTKIQVEDAKGNPVAGVRVLPSSRKTKTGQEHMTYAMQIADSEQITDSNGIVHLDSFQPDDQAEITIDVKGDVQNHSIKIGSEATSVVTVAGDLDAAAVVITGTVTDTTGSPIPNAKLLIVRKTWPGGRFKMDSPNGETDAKGEFTLNDFVPANLTYEFMVTVIKDGYAMVSEYRGMDDEDQDAPVHLTLEPAEAITFTVVDAAGKPAVGASLTPHTRSSDATIPYLNFPINRTQIVYTTDSEGKAIMTAWKPGEKGRLMWEHDGNKNQTDFQVPANRMVTVQLP